MTLIIALQLDEKPELRLVEAPNLRSLEFARCVFFDAPCIGWHSGAMRILHYFKWLMPPDCIDISCCETSGGAPLCLSLVEHSVRDCCAMCGHAGGSGKLGIMRLEVDEVDFKHMIPPLGPDVQLVEPEGRSIVLVRDGRLTDIALHD